MTGVVSIRAGVGPFFGMLLGIPDTIMSKAYVAIIGMSRLTLIFFLCTSRDSLTAVWETITGRTLSNRNLQQSD